MRETDGDRDRKGKQAWRVRDRERHAESETQRQGEMESGEVETEFINGVMSTLVSGQGFEFLKEWNGGYYTLLLLSLLQTDDKTKAQQNPQARAPLLF